MKHLKKHFLPTRNGVNCRSSYGELRTPDRSGGFSSRRDRLFPVRTLVSVLLAGTVAFEVPSNAFAQDESTPRPSYPVVDTGQHACYGAIGNVRLTACPAPGARYYGQDAQYSANESSYTDNGDGTVTDNVTGLMWQKSFTDDVAWSDAAGLAAKADTGGYRDWRVPTIKELYSLIDFSGSTGTGRPDSPTPPSDAAPYIDIQAFDFEYPSQSWALPGAGSRYIDAQYISSTVYTGTTMRGVRTFFGVNFADGRIKGYPLEGGPNRGWDLRLVRGPRDYGVNNFADNGDGTVSDSATGLMWMKADSGDTAFTGAVADNHYPDGRMDWPEALAFCEASSHAGYSDWRLPNAKELQTIVDYSRSLQATRSAAINPVFAATTISDERGSANYAGYWTSTTLLDGREPGTDAVVVYFGEALGSLSFGFGRPRASRDISDIMDVHGAGAQRSDPKTGDPAAYPVFGFGPQGDVRRVYNLVRCTRTMRLK